MIPLPSLLAPLVDKIDRIARPWNSYLQQFTQAPPAINSITVGASPFSYVAREPGNISITGGTLINNGIGNNGISLTRGNVIIDFGTVTNRIVPIGINDIIKINYSVLPTVMFLPSYGQVAA